MRRGSISAGEGDGVGYIVLAIGAEYFVSWYITMVFFEAVKMGYTGWLRGIDTKQLLAFEKLVFA